MHGQIIIEFDRPIYRVPQNHEHQYDAKELRDIAKFLESIADKMDKIAEALKPQKKVEDIPF